MGGLVKTWDSVGNAGRFAGRAVEPVGGARHLERTSGRGLKSRAQAWELSAKGPWEPGMLMHLGSGVGIKETEVQRGVRGGTVSKACRRHEDWGLRGRAENQAGRWEMGGGGLQADLRTGSELDVGPSCVLGCGHQLCLRWWWVGLDVGGQLGPSAQGWGSAGAGGLGPAGLYLHR